MSCKFEEDNSYNDIKEYHCKKYLDKNRIRCTIFNQPACYEEEQDMEQIKEMTIKTNGGYY